MQDFGPLGEADGTDFVDESLPTTPGSVIPAKAFNQMRDELLAFILAGGLTPSGANLAQVLEAFNVLSGFRYVAASSIPSTGSVASVSIPTGLSEKFIAHLISFAPASSDVELWMRTSQNGSTYDSGGSDYQRTWVNNGDGIVAAASDSKIMVCGGAAASASVGTTGCSGLVLVNRILRMVLSIFAYQSPASNSNFFLGAGYRSLGTAFIAEQFQFESGNIAGGSIHTFLMK